MEEWKDLRQTISKEQRKGRSIWLMSSRPAARTLLEMVSWDLVCFDLEDFWPDLVWFESVGLESCRRLLEGADLVTANGMVSAQRVREFFGVNALNLPNGVDRKLIEELEEPGPRAPWLLEGGPHAVFLGMINDRMDLDLLLRLAKAASRWNFWLVGPVELPSDRIGLWNQLLAHPSCHHVPRVPHHEVPAILRGAD
ncbi:MAG: hypothetical protein SNJ84_10865, partial [Verrucomicrobiia bacterium]